MKTNGIAAAATIGLLCAGMACAASDARAASSDGSIAIGAFFPGTRSAGDQRAWFSAEAAYTFAPRAGGVTFPACVRLAVGVETERNTDDTGFLNLSDTVAVVPITVTEMVRLSGRSPVAGRAAYAGLGVGGCLAVDTFATVGGVGLVEAGYNPSAETFVLVRYQEIVFNGATPKGVLLEAGVRF